MKRSSLLIGLIVAALVLGACGQAAAPTAAPASDATAAAPSSTATANPGATALPAGAITINGAGATFPDPVYTEWRFAYQYVDPSVIINYQAIGSGGGKKGIADKTIDFAGSDSLLTDAEYAANPTLQMFPTLAGALVPIFNIAEVTQTLTLDGPVLAGIYGGTITKWSDPAIVTLNPGLALPDQAIAAVHRSDGSGTTEIFTKFLSAVSEEWKNGPGAGSAVEWPVDKAGTGVGGKGNAGVAAAVQNTPYAIGYVELSYAVANKIAFAQMVNASGNTVQANAESLQSAMSDFSGQFTDRLTIDLISNGPGAGTWPIAGYTYQVIYMDMQPDATYGCVKPAKYLNWVYWFLTDPGAAKRASDLGYATLPENVRSRVFETLAKVTCEGKPIDSNISMMK